MNAARTLCLAALMLVAAAFPPRREPPRRGEDPPVGIAMSTDPERYLASLAASPGGYRFLVAGHVYGRHTPVTTGLFTPLAESWRKTPPARDAAFAVLTGDVVARRRAAFFDALDRDLAAFGRPVFVAPGNHDLAPHGGAGRLFVKRYGKTRLAWRIGRDAFAVCNSVDGGGNVGDADLAAIKELISKKPRALFVFVHHLVWVDREKVEAGRAPARLVNGINAGYARRGTFDDVLLPLLRKSGATVFVVAGDIGSFSSVVEWYERRGENVHLIASGMGDHPLVGAYLTVHVTAAGIAFETHALRGGGSRIPERRFRVR